MKFVWILAAAVLACKAFGAELKVEDKDLPRFLPTEPSNAVSKIKVRDGFRVELMASEPLIESPVAMAFDEFGRLFVVEMRDYSERRDEVLGRVKLLEDTNGDGRFDKANLYATNLPWPTAIICWNGGVFVGASPDILFLSDTNGDGKADERRAVFTGFASAAPKLNVQQLLNSFAWGLDNRIHGALGGNPSVVTNLMRPGDKPLELRGRDFSFDPRTFDLRAESGGGQWGITFDDAGHKFTCSNARHIIAVMFDDRVAARNPFYAMPSPAVDIAVDGPAAEIFRVSPEEPWRVLRTKWRVAGAVTGPIEGGGRASGYFSGASGITIYRGDAFPAEYRGDAFIADSGSNLIHRKKIRRDGLNLIAERPADERDREFLAGTETWFRPISLADAPDGTLWFIDMYREVIEHPWSLPPELKSRIDLNSGSSRGRIYRVVPESLQPRESKYAGSSSETWRFAEMNLRQLAQSIALMNGWHSDTAARLLVEGNDTNAVPMIRSVLQGSAPRARLRALHVLHSLGSLTPEDIEKGLKDSSPEVRAHAIQFATAKQATALAEDADMRVRYAVAFATTNADALAKIAARDVENSWMRAALLNGSLAAAGDLFVRFANDAAFLRRTGAVEFASQLALIIGAANRSNELARMMPELARSPEAMSFADALGRGLARSGQSLSAPHIAQYTQPLLARARESATNAAAATAQRIIAAHLLRFSNYEASGDALNALLNLSVAPPLQVAATESLISFHDGRGVTNVLMRWNHLAPQTRSRAISLILARPFDTMVLLDEVENNVVSRNEFSAADVQRMFALREATVRERAKAMFQSKPTARAELLKEFSPALQLNGDAQRGHKVFMERCASCHRAGKDGFAVGPDMASVAANGKEKLLTSIVDPNAEVASAFLAYTVETKEGDVFYGLLSGDNPQTVTIKMPNGVTEQISRAAITTLRSSEKSMMPEGVEARMKPQEMADLLEFIVNRKAAK